MRSRTAVKAALSAGVVLVLGAAGAALTPAGAGSSTARGWSRATSGAAVASDQPAAPDITTGQTITLIEKDTKFKDLDLGKKGFSTGDEFMFEADLLDPTSSAKKGTLDVSCTALFALAHCEGAASLSGRGQIEIEGVIGGSSTFPIAVTGGTGDFQNARGQLRVTNTSDTTSRLVFQLIP